MNILIAACLLASLPVSAAINCYKCSLLSDGCSDPFNATGSGVTQTGVNSTDTYCKKEVALGVAKRSGETSCSATKFLLNSGIACCQTDLCNGAHANYQMSTMLVVGLVVILTTVQWA